MRTYSELTSESCTVNWWPYRARNIISVMTKVLRTFALKFGSMLISTQKSASRVVWMTAKAIVRPALEGHPWTTTNRLNLLYQACHDVSYFAASGAASVIWLHSSQRTSEELKFVE